MENYTTTHMACRTENSVTETQALRQERHGMKQQAKQWTRTTSAKSTQRRKQWDSSPIVFSF